MKEDKVDYTNIMTDRFMVYDENDTFYDLYEFKGKVNAEDIINIIKEVKTNMVGEWTMEDIEKAIKEKLPVKSCKKFDYILKNLCEVMKDI